jgi:hypothetical protein
VSTAFVIIIFWLITYSLSSKLPCILDLVKVKLC